jgi:Zn-dependent peptidase ImmA (M78 family)
MRYPKAFQHKGKTWRVVYEADLKHDDGTICDGLCDLEGRVIYLDAKLKGRKKKTTFLHELCHVLVHEAHINPGVRFSEGVEEVLCDAFADMLSTAFTNIKWKKTK